jgi:hypothetical protein
MRKVRHGVADPEAAQPGVVARVAGEPETAGGAARRHHELVSTAWLQAADRVIESPPAHLGRPNRLSTSTANIAGICWKDPCMLVSLSGVTDPN